MQLQGESANSPQTTLDVRIEIEWMELDAVTVASIPLCHPSIIQYNH